MKRLRFVTWAEVERLPVWFYWQGVLRLQWWDKDKVKGVLPWCEECGMWYVGAACPACTLGREHAVYCAQCDVLQNMTRWTGVFELRSGDIGLTHITGIVGIILRFLRRIGLKAPELGHAFMLKWDGERWLQLEMAWPHGRAVEWDSGQAADYYRVDRMNDMVAAQVADQFEFVYSGLPYGTLTALLFVLRRLWESVTGRMAFAQAVMVRDAICTQAIVLSILNATGLDLVPGCDDLLKRWVTADDIRDSDLTRMLEV